MPQLLLSLLGPFQIALDDQPVRAGLWAKTQALLAYLAAEADAYHRRESLAGLIWPDQPEEAARHSLRQSLLQLRHAIGKGEPPFLCITPQAIQFNRASDHWLDLVEFSDLVGQCERHAHRRAETCSACIKRLERAMTLYRGDLLADFFLKDSSPFEEWALVKREQIARMAMAALHTLAEHYALRADYAAMEQAARRQIGIDPFYESAHRQLMRALTWMGQRNEALAHYADLFRMLADELSITPDRETRALGARIEAEALPAPQTSRASRLKNRPAEARLTPFVGRERELEQIAGYLRTPGARLVTLTGPGGVGKTRLALKVAEQEAYTFRDGVFFAPLASVGSIELVAPALAEALSIALDPAVDPASQVLDRLRESDRELLLVLDSLEHLDAATPLATGLLAACPGITLLVASQAPLHVSGEQVFPVPPLELPDLAHHTLHDPDRVAALAHSPGVALFVERARTVQPDFCLTPENAHAIAAICAQLDGLPLAIELAAARSRLLSPQMILERLNHRIEFLTGGPLDGDPRHRTWRATLDWSHDRLDARQRKLFARLAVFVGGCTLDALQAVCGESDESPAAARAAADPATGCLEPLEALLDKSLLQRQDIGDETRVTMLETIREYALERLVASGEAAAIRQRHAAFLLRLAEQAESELTGPRQAAWLARLDREHGNVHAALEWALSSEDAETAAQLCARLMRFWVMRGRLDQGRQWLERTLVLARRASLPAPIQARLLNAESSLALYPGGQAATRAL